MAGHSYSHLAALATTTLAQGGPGVLHHVTINAAGTAMTVTLFDSTTGSGTTIAAISAPVAGGTYEYDAIFNNGLTVVIGGTTAGDITVTWR